MLKTIQQGQFVSLNRGYNSTFQPNRLSLGLVVPIEHYPHHAIPSLEQHVERIQLAEELGFSAVWLRDIPFHVPSFGDVGQIFDPFVYLGLLAGKTRDIALGVASIILPLRHPAHIAKAAASADVLSNGRILLGVASGDRPDEYPAIGIPYEERGQLFRESYNYIRDVAENHDHIGNYYGSPDTKIELLPKPVAQRIPILFTGSCQQNSEWIASHGDGWMTYPRSVVQQAQTIHNWREKVLENTPHDKPAMQSLYIDLIDDPHASAQPIHLGFRLGIYALKDYLKSIEAIGINHVALNLRFNQADISKTLKILSEKLLPEFNHKEKKNV